MASRTTLALAAALSAGGGTAAAADALKVLDAALRPPEVAYRGKLAVTRWYGGRSRSEEAYVYFAPPGRYRWEFLSPAEAVVRTVVSDGRTEVLRAGGKAYFGDALRSSPRRLTPDDERALLLRNYAVRLAGEEPVAGRHAWILELRPRRDDRPRQKLWIDSATGAVLENKRFRPKGPVAVAARFVRFELVGSHPQELFSVDASSGRPEPHGLDPDSLSIEELNSALGPARPFPEELPGGFRFESANFLDSGGRTVRHLRYTDGLAVVSLFQTDRPVRLSTALLEAPEPSAGAIRLSSAGKVLHFKAGHAFLTLISDVSGPLLDAIAASLK